MKKVLNTILALAVTLPVMANQTSLDEWKKKLEAQRQENQETTISLNDKPELYSHLYRNLSEEEKTELFEAKRKFMDNGGIVPDMTAACSRWVSISNVVRASIQANQVQEVYFDADRL